MTLNNKNWLENEAFRMYLSGDSQETIANKLNISVGTVNTYVNNFLKSDDTLGLQREIAIVVKKNRVNIKQIAANLRLKNVIKNACLDDRKAEKFLDTMDMLCNKYGLDPDIAAKNSSL